MSEDAQGNKVARAVWDYLQDMKGVELVPWVSNPNSDRYDPIKVAEHAGYERAMKEIEQIMRETAS